MSRFNFELAVCCNKFRRTQQISDVFEDAGTDFENFPYYYLRGNLVEI